MPAFDFPSRVTRLAAMLSLLLFGLCIGAAFYLYHQQAITAENLGENIGSRRAARDLKAALEKLVGALAEGNLNVADLNREIHAHLQEAERLADKEEESRLVRQLEHSFDRYLKQMQVAGDEGLRGGLLILETETLPLCIKLHSFNAEQIDLSEAEHRRTVQRMAIGLGVVGTLGSLLGIFLGYSVARHLKRSIYQMSVCVRDAAGKLGQDLPTVNLSGTGDLHALREQMQGVVRDIEQMVERLQQREHEVLRAEQMSAVGQLAAGAAHELRNPLTSIKMLVQANREKAEQAALPQGQLVLVEQEIRRMEKCLQRFIDFARPPKPECRPMALAPVVERTFALIETRARKQKVRLDFKNWPTPLVVAADGEQIHQVLINLTLNALDAMPAGGELRVELAPTDDGQVELRVLDSGSGIAAERLPRLFEPFASSKETGLGLGLVVSRRIAENHRGTLDGKNRPEGGACFTLRLPAAAPIGVEPEAAGVAAMSTTTPRY